MFNFVSTRLFFLSRLPITSNFFDAILNICTIITRPEVLEFIDEIESQLINYGNIQICSHRYGGIEFRTNNKEVGHIHGHGLVDIPFPKRIKAILIKDPHIYNHHKFSDTGWISLWVTDKTTMQKAIRILKYSAQLKINN